MSRHEPRSRTTASCHSRRRHGAAVRRRGHTIIVLGDIAIHGLWGSRRKRVLKAPGRKILVIGNHEADGAGGVEVDGFDEAYSTLYVGGDPPLVMTYIPLRTVPVGCVNVHGHIHHHPVPGRTRHINVFVEQVHYRPRTLTSIRRLAARIVRGETVTGRTTAHQLAQVV